MLRTAIPGLKKILDSDPERGTTILVTGDAGTLKTSFVLGVMSNYLRKQQKEVGLFVTIDENRDNLLRYAQKMGMKIPRSLFFSDIASFRMELGGNNPAHIHSAMYWEQVEHLMLRNVERIQKRYKMDRKMLENETKPSVYALDSLNGLLAMSDVLDANGNLISPINVHSKLFELLYLLKENDAVNFLVYESSGQSSVPEFKAVDGIIELGIIDIKGVHKRYIQIKKMKGINHRLEKYEIRVGNNGLEIMGKII